jgi:phosphopantothenoylcysteine decarboxylase / phosphopantothenate---cysteine ligase
MRVLLGVGGGIAAYKSAEIVRSLKSRGDDVRVIMTSSAQEFITPLTLQVLSEEPVGLNLFDAHYESTIGHIDLARWADIFVVAPATANLVARLAHGMANDLLTTVALATKAPLVVCPAMNTQMLGHPAVADNLSTLRKRGTLVVDPDAGTLACGEVGAGRLPDARELLEEIDRAVTAPILKDKKVLITAGPTREVIDPARFLSNPSSGKMGFALARAAARAGAAHVKLVTGPSHDWVSGPAIERVNVVSAQEMATAVLSEAAQVDFVVKAAAVADWTPVESTATKQEKTPGQMPLHLKRTIDILLTLGQQFETLDPQARPYLIGFAAETDDVAHRAREKRVRKKADMIIGNLIGGGNSAFGRDENTVHIITAASEDIVGPASKDHIADCIWRSACEERFQGIGR